MSHFIDQFADAIRMPVLPLRDIVVFPHMIVPLFVGRERSIQALDAVTAGREEDRRILLVSQKDASTDNPTPEDVYEVGVEGSILQLLKLPDGTVKVLVEGMRRLRIDRFTQTEPFFEAEASPMVAPPYSDAEARALMRSVITQFEAYAKLNKKVPPEVLMTFQSIDDPARLADTAASHLTLKVADKQALLEVDSVIEQLERLYVSLEQEIEVFQVEKRIRGRVKRQMEKSHRDYYLNEQMKAIQKELGEKDDEKDELTELAEKIQECGMSEEAQKKAESELKKLKQMSPMSAEATVVRNYIDWLVSIPWAQASELKHDLREAERILDEDHDGLQKVKERIIEHLAVQQKVEKIKGPILCLVGPPGVGKTSLAKSIARATGREYVRISLGGVRDEAEIRGHRRTYIGSMPGKIIQSMKKAGTKNPLFLLDEIDKVGNDYRGDPSSALLEVLDPEQNSAFNDHYMEVDYDLSNVLFLTTANSLNIPRPLLDRMEVIRLAGYTEEEKTRIATRYLVPRQMENHGLDAKEFSLSSSALLDIIRYYTRESGVRNLEREIASLNRKAARILLTEKARKKVAITAQNLEKHLGVRKYRFGLAEEHDHVGVTTGLAWTEVGGELLTIEAITLEGKGKVTITGKLGDVMQESAQAALTYARSRAREWGISADFFQENDIHIHVPEGATPKDGPSAGIAMCTTLCSALTGIPVRKDVAMTGEITLRGRALIIGGLKEKLLAAHRGGIKHVLIPEENVKDLKEVAQSVLKDLEIHPVSHMDQVLELALTQSPSRPLADGDEETTAAPPTPAEKKLGDESPTLPH
ncbi:endopeptidase La [Magnetofaba australis]|uniref:Lon protease n=1 Tax=Magnetofaba australis IT-1 TaxID=1434232 RepID=A0A1Y2K0M0_9PROT|nr:endopeptidase La [Magnetofaba australis]OSM00344.1 putative Lon-A peptidase [Magnetofaba australis IT-1]